jgi:hypothetical protein
MLPVKMPLDPSRIAIVLISPLTGISCILFLPGRPIGE